MDTELMELRNANHAADETYKEMSAEECHECCIHADACDSLWWLMMCRKPDVAEMRCRDCMEWEERR